MILPSDWLLCRYLPNCKTSRKYNNNTDYLWVKKPSPAVKKHIYICNFTYKQELTTERSQIFEMLHTPQTPDAQTVSCYYVNGWYNVSVRIMADLILYTCTHLYSCTLWWCGSLIALTAERRRTSSPWKDSLRWAPGWWGGRRRSARRSTPSGRLLPLIPAD